MALQKASESHSKNVLGLPIRTGIDLETAEPYPAPSEAGRELGWSRRMPVRNVKIRTMGINSEKYDDALL
ncbi:hypothetical protein N7463_007413 [Penicillium fimorum]|uniref:Uncharacterized protein n=1 Tax=Penicillium fimorum TaxID=1882269 RepID=A0A9W9XWK4_9EURO|nr:hypothetical protein N7463_007413 [Penicillium fimorum]